MGAWTGRLDWEQTDCRGAVAARTHSGYSVYMSQTVSVRHLREHLADVLAAVAEGNHIVVTHRGRPVARLIPENRDAPLDEPAYPLRGSVLRMSDDFDEPLDGLWEAVSS